MIVVQKYKDDAERFKNLTSAVTFESCKKRLRLYFRNIGQIKAMLYAGKIIDIPFVTLQRDRRIRDFKVSDERRKSPRETVLK